MKNQITVNPKLQSYFDFYNELAASSNIRVVQSCTAAFLYFGLLGLSWVIPFPYLKFLGQYNSFFNWSSFVIAFSIYYYSTLSPLLSYIMLFLTLIFTYIISVITFNYADFGKWLLVFAAVMFVAEAIRLISIKSTGKNSTIKMELLFIVIGPLWALHFVLKNKNIRY